MVTLTVFAVKTVGLCSIPSPVKPVASKLTFTAFLRNVQQNKAVEASHRVW